MKRRAPPSLTILITLGVAACNAPALDGITSYDEPPDPPATTTTAAATSIDPSPTTRGDESSSSTTDDPGSTSASSGSTGPLDPDAPPTILEHTLGPDPLEQAGLIATMIATADADGVYMQLDGAAPVELALTGPDSFYSEIALYTALKNGDHAATFVAWRDALESAPLVLPFTVALPPAGSEQYWNSDGAIGQGTVVALAVTPNNELIELGIYYPIGPPQCYLRRRDLGGAWSPDADFKNFMPDVPCSAIDLAIGPDGAIYVLAERLENGQFRWWLGKFDTWAAPLINISSGTPGETAYALASDPTRIAVCGTKPFGADSHDATAWISTPNQPGKILSFDYVPEDKSEHTIRETPRDCLFTDKHLVLAGEAWGPHDIGDIKRDRHFLLEIDVAAGLSTWAVAGPETGTQSTAQTIALDSQGRYITGGQTCDDNCDNPTGELRMFLPGGAQFWQRPLDPGIAAPRDLAWSPADYLVLVSAKQQGPNDTAFFAQAWFPLKDVPIWSYDHHDAPDFQSAGALAIGPYGQIYAGGQGASGLPAIAIIAP